MEYQIGIACRAKYLRPSIAGLNTKIVERDTMDEVVEYIDSCLDETELMQQEYKYWSYIENIHPEPDNIRSPEWPRMRYAVIEFGDEDGYKWSIDITECSENAKDYYKEPKFTYKEIDE